MTTENCGQSELEAGAGRTPGSNAGAGSQQACQQYLSWSLKAEKWINAKSIMGMMSLATLHPAKR